MVISGLLGGIGQLHEWLKIGKGSGQIGPEFN